MHFSLGELKPDFQITSYKPGYSSTKSLEPNSSHHIDGLVQDFSISSSNGVTAVFH